MNKKFLAVVLWLILIAIIIVYFQPYPKRSPSKEIREDELINYERITYYYRDPQPTELVPILESIFKEKDVISNSKLFVPLAHFFSTAFQKDRSKLEELKVLQQNYSGEAKKSIKKIIEETNNYQPANLKSPEDLDLLWAEFKAAGDKGIIERIIKVIAWPEQPKAKGLEDSAKKFLIKIIPRHFEIYSMLCKKTDSSMGMEKIVIDEIVSIIKVSAFNPANEHMMRGLNFANLRKYMEALEEYKKGLSYFPDYAPIHDNMATVYDRNGQLEKAVKAGEKAVSIDPEDPIASYNLGNFYNRSNKPDKAIKYFLKALEYHPNDSDYHHGLARAYQQKGDTENAVIHFKKYLEYGPDETYVPWVKKYLASVGQPVEEDPTDIVVMLRNKRYADLEKQLISLLRKKSKDKEGRSLLSQDYQKLLSNLGTDSSYQIRIAQLKEWLTEHKSSHFANACLGRLYIDYAWFARGTGWGSSITQEASRLLEERLLTAKEHLEKSYLLDPSDPIVPAWLITVAMGLSLDREEMEKQFKRGVLADPADHEVYFGKLNYLMPKWYGSEEEMFAFAREAARKAPPNSRVPLVLTAAHWEMYYRSDNNASYFRNPVVWKEMKEVYLRVSKSFPESKGIHNWFAGTAYLARDYEIAREELKLIGDDWLDAVWGDKKSFDEIKKELLGR